MERARLNKLSGFPQDRYSAFSMHCKLYVGTECAVFPKCISPQNVPPSPVMLVIILSDSCIPRDKVWKCWPYMNSQCHTAVDSVVF